MTLIFVCTLPPLRQRAQKPNTIETSRNKTKVLLVRYDNMSSSNTQLLTVQYRLSNTETHVSSLTTEQEDYILVDRNATSISDKPLLPFPSVLPDILRSSPAGRRGYRRPLPLASRKSQVKHRHPCRSRSSSSLPDAPFTVSSPPVVSGYLRKMTRPISAGVSPMQLLT